MERRSSLVVLSQYFLFALASSSSLILFTVFFKLNFPIKIKKDEPCFDTAQQPQSRKDAKGFKRRKIQDKRLKTTTMLRPFDKLKATQAQ